MVLSYPILDVPMAVYFSTLSYDGFEFCLTNLVLSSKM
jgi:hypothetical protein